MATTTQPLTLAEYQALPPSNRRTELVCGEVVEMNVHKPEHAWLVTLLSNHLFNWVGPRKLGRVLAGDAGVITTRSPDSLRGADVAYWSYARLPANSSLREFPQQAPELVVEVRSANDRWSEVFAKVTEYLRAGVQVVVVVAPAQQTLWVCRDAHEPEQLRRGETLRIDDVLPGFELELEAFWSTAQ